jgi:hypothetical protein
MAQKFGPFVKIVYLILFHQNMTTFLKTIPVPKSVKNPGLFCFIWKKYRKQNIFSRPLLSFAAEESASWEHWLRYQPLPAELLGLIPCQPGCWLPAGEATFRLGVTGGGGMDPDLSPRVIRRRFSRL